MSKNDNCTTRNLLDLSYHQKYYKSIRIDLSRQKKTSIPQKIKFNENYSLGKEIMNNAEVLKSNLCEYNDGYISVREYITVTTALATQVLFKTLCTIY